MEDIISYLDLSKMSERVTLNRLVNTLASPSPILHHPPHDLNTEYEAWLRSEDNDLLVCSVQCAGLSGLWSLSQGPGVTGYQEPDPQVCV